MKCPECGAAIDDRFEKFRLIEWGPSPDGMVTLETNVGHLNPAQRAAFLAALNVFVDELNKERVE